MTELAVELMIVVLLLVANGVFAMTEIAVVSANKGRLRRLADDGDERAKAALELAESPNRFLATVQCGITLVGVIAGAFGGARLSEHLVPHLAPLPLVGSYARPVAFGVVVLLITYLSLVLGELVPKRIGLGNPEGVALLVSRFMRRVSATCAPVVDLLSGSTDMLLGIFGFKSNKGSQITEDEVRGLMSEGMRAGAFNKVESEIVSSVLELDQLRVRDLMTPRTKVIFLNQDDPHEAIWHKIVVSNHSYFPVYAGNRDHIVGLVSVKSIYANLAANAGVRLKDLMVPPLVVPESQDALQLLETLKQRGKHLALVADEFGGISGLVSINDVMEAIVGEFPTAEERARPGAQKREDGTWLVDGLMEVDRVAKTIPDVAFDQDEYQTLSGYITKHLGHLPKEGETFRDQGYVWEVLDMDRHRVDKILVTPMKPPMH